MQYLREFRTKIQAQIEICKRSETSAMERELLKHERTLKDLDAYESILYSLAIKHFELDLDDGVKVNYGKIGNVLYPVEGLNKEKK